MVTPMTTPRRGNSPDQAVIPFSTTAARRVNIIDASGILGGDSSSFSVLRENWLDTSAVAAAAALPMPHHRSVLPLPRALEPSSSRTPGGHLGMTHMLGANGMMSVVCVPAENSVRHHTFSWQQRASPTRGRVRPASSLSTNGPRQRAPSNTRVTLNASVSRLKGLHAPDASCCGYQRAAEHATHSATSDKVFVTFCEQSLVQRVDEAQKELEMERDARGNDAHQHKTDTVHLLRALHAAEAERDDLRARHTALESEHATHLANASIIRDAFERRTADVEAALAADRKELEELRAFKRTASIAEDARNADLEEAQRRAQELKASLALSGKESADNARRAQQYFEELTIARKNVAASEKENADLRETLAAREAIIRGMEKELQLAAEKLSSVAVLRSAFKAKK